jgi:hypothetical protein
VRISLIIFFIFFVFGIRVLINDSSPKTVQTTVGYNQTKKMRKPAFAFKAPTTPIEDEGAEEDAELFEGEKGCPQGSCYGEGMVLAPLGGTEKIAGSLNPIVMAFSGYSNSDAIDDLIRAARQHIEDNPHRYIIRKPNGRVQTYCYGAVKDALRAAGMLTGGYNCSGYARNCVNDLEDKRAGFRNLLDLPSKNDPNYETKMAINSMLVNHPEMAPKGTILVYRTVPGAKRSNGKAVDMAGHTEIKVGDVGEDLYISVSEKDVPTYGYSLVTQRNLIGVMYLPKLLSPDSIYYQGRTTF